MSRISSTSSGDSIPNGEKSCLCSKHARHERKELGGKIARAKKDGLSADELLTAGQLFGEQIKEQEAALEKVEHEQHHLALTLPNLPHESVPVGHSEADNTEVRRHGDPPQFDFEPKSHWDLVQRSGSWISSGLRRSPGRVLPS